MAAELTSVEYGRASWPATQSVAISPFSFAETVERLKRAIAAENLWLIHEIDPQVLLERGGFASGAARQLLFFHPRYAARLLAVDPSALIEVPLKLLVLQMADGSVTVRHTRVEELFARYPGLAELSRELSTLYRRLHAAL